MRPASPRGRKTRHAWRDAWLVRQGEKMRGQKIRPAFTKGDGRKCFCFRDANGPRCPRARQRPRLCADKFPLLAVHPAGLSVHARGIRHDPRGTIFQLGEKEQAAFAGEVQTFTRNFPPAGKVHDFFRRAVPKIRQDGLGLGVRRFALWPGRAWRGRKMSACKFHEFSAGVFL